MPSTPIVQYFSPNILGRDFVVGDIHGAYHTLMLALQRVAFNPKIDRLFLVGDLIDRGPNSYLCAAFLQLPYVHAVRGNHEDMLIEMHKEGEPDPDHVAWMVKNNGLGWWLSTPKDVQSAIVRAVKSLPLVMQIATARGTVGIVHGDVPRGMSWQTFICELQSGVSETEVTALWGRERIETGNTEGVQGIDRLFVGHTVQWDGVTKLGNVYAIDTGAIFAELGQSPQARLTLANLACDSRVLVEPRIPQLIDIFEAPLTKPFGQYSVDIFKI